jgi:hypothetical protein
VYLDRELCPNQGAGRENRRLRRRRTSRSDS